MFITSFTSKSKKFLFNVAFDVFEHFCCSNEPKAFTVEFHDGNEGIIDITIDVLVVFCLKLCIVEVLVVSTSN